ncbi:MAG: hypothetical protein IJL26_00230 [Clostridia bacterium]|nr:hypothetical protein [Clostridia bacterium]
MKPGNKTYPKEYIANPHMLGENRIPARTLLIPAQKRGVTHKNVSESDRIRILNGAWKFRYLAEDTLEPFYEPSYDDGTWDTLPVPSMWQFHGYGSCYYPNVRYCFPYDPPYIHRDNPVGLYRKTFSAEYCAQDRAILRFLGVDNAYFVWLNGRYIGFSKGSRIPAEFDVTDALQPGENLLAVKVYTFSDASYLENQDMLMASGIFRDVMLIRTGATALWDYTVLSDSTGFIVKYSCSVGETPSVIRFTVCDARGNVCVLRENPVIASASVHLPVENAVAWNAEQPYLYWLYIEILQNGSVIETHTKRIGIAKSEIKGCRLLMNGTPITLKGVNRHENNARTGRAITAEQIEKELLDIKSCNLNAIRCSHYTNQPLFYELCSELGIYVMDEADCESHGAECTGDQGALNRDDEWFDAFFDRISRMYAIDKNETCINIWSLGNECGRGKNAEKCALWLRDQDIKKPLNDVDSPAVCGGNFCSTGYMPMQTLRDSVPKNGPLLMVEYAHAMGNSPGGLEDIWNWVYENEHCCGGYVWEFKSHGFFRQGKDGKPRYLYGGDFPDVYHWSNFSLDGYHTSDGTPKPAWGELREVSAPIYVRWHSDGVEVKNTFDFNTFDGVVLKWTVSADGITVRGGEVSLDGLHARERRFIPIDLKTERLVGLITADCIFCKNGDQIAHKQKILADIPKPLDEYPAFIHTVSVFDHGIRIVADGFSAVVSDGLLSEIKVGGNVILDSPMRLNCYRAPTDNDGAIFPPNHGEDWRDKLVPSMRFGCHTVSFTDEPEHVTITAVGKFLPFSHDWGFDTSLKYTVSAEGKTDISVRMIPYGNDMPAILPRVGVVFDLPSDYESCRWLGRGPFENYSDCKANAPIGIYQATVSEMNFSYDVPQETGNHGDCRRVTVFGARRKLTAEGVFSFSLHDFTLDALDRARHCDELEKCNRKYLYLDHRMRGLGSHSCGPEPEKEYELPIGEYQWSFRLLPNADNR